MSLELFDLLGNKVFTEGSDIKKVSEKLDLFGDGFGSVELWDFSGANASKEARVKAATTIASVCYGNPAVIGSEKLFDQLYTESIGLPSSAFEFIPVLLRSADYEFILDKFESLIAVAPEFMQKPNVDKYGFTIVFQGNLMKLTNLRALIRDIKLIENYSGPSGWTDIENRFFNSDPDEILFIKQLVHTFRSDMDIVTARQIMRHRASWQELSRRYTSGTKVPFSIYLTEPMLKEEVFIEVGGEKISADKLARLCIDMYDKAIEQKIKPQEARRIIPQGAITKVWSSWADPHVFEMFNLRISSKAQNEVRAIATAMYSLISEEGLAP